MKFNLVRFFALSGLAAFVVVVVVLGVSQRQIAIDNLIALEESNNVNLTRTFANSLWPRFRPLAGVGTPPAAAEQAGLRAAVLGLMRGSSVVKIKVYDLDGLTVFSTEAEQIGEDKSTNAGFASARGGIAASELTHRDSFSAFEATVEDRDVLSSYVPIVNADTGLTEGVFEIYTDVTPFLARIQRTSWQLSALATAILALLFVALFALIRHADRTIRRQAEENTRAQMQIAQTEKMASLGQMVAGVAHELNTPLAFTRSNVGMLSEFVNELRLPLNCGSQLIRQIRDSDSEQVSVRIKVTRKMRAKMFELDDELSAEMLQQMLSDTLKGLDQMSELVVHLSEFTRLDRARVDEYDVNKGIRNVIYIARSSISPKIRFETELGQVPVLRCIPSQMNQILINLINNAAQAIGEAEGVITVTTAVEGDQVKIEVRDDGCGIPDRIREHIFEPFFTTRAAQHGTGLGLSIVHDILREHGADIRVESQPGAGSRFTLLLPQTMESEQRLAA